MDYDRGDERWKVYDAGGGAVGHDPERSARANPGEFVLREMPRPGDDDQPYRQRAQRTGSVVGVAAVAGIRGGPETRQS